MNLETGLGISGREAIMELRDNAVFETDDTHDSVFKSSRLMPPA